jgi:cholest-4-en-3-one 26-monooxygenase
MSSGPTTEVVATDLTDPDLFVSGGHHEVFTRLRRDDPVHWHPEADGPGFWCLTRHEHVKLASRDNVLFSSSVQGVNIPDLDDHAGADNASMAREMMVMMDPPRHTRYRLLVNKGFTPRVIGRLEAHLQAKARVIVDGLVDRVDPGTGTGACDAVTDLAADLPLQAITELVGVPEEDRHRIFEWSNALVGSDDPEFGAMEGTMEASAEMFVYAMALREQRLADPGDDIVSALLGAEIDGQTLTEAEFAMFFLLLCVAGNETTRNATVHGLRALVDHDQYDRLAAEPDLLPTAVDEILRWASPIHHFRRTATDDTIVGGRTIRAGDKVVLWYASANRDEDVFDDPFRFDLTRTPNDHVSFGAGGPHFCLGANLARLELRLIFAELTTRLTDIEVTGPPELLRSNFVHGLKHLPISYRVRAPAAHPAA